jgi:hypothetical protein
VFYNLNTRACVRRTKWKKVHTNQLVIIKMNELAGGDGVSLADLEIVENASDVEESMEVVHQPPVNPSVTATAEERAIEDDTLMPDLVDQEDEDDSDSNSKAEDDDEDADELEQILQ